MRQFLKILSWPFIGLIKIYQWVISPWLGPKCRYTPTCSHYSLQAFKKYGLFKGFWLSVKEYPVAIPGEEVATIRSVKMFKV
ncbi:membrane protein insertion efficiency factor YidD [Niabella sp. W65]|nr:membrane protein insertion efficiency factor YidD [Niabella sp. W65]MCH7368245.1 membrane protein insertion efficiency factor YidD [Niabella sp. W65]ULT43850.1 membrane protein insertion efficiency factor YidD [Niabella sp. I65]